MCSSYYESEIHSGKVEVIGEIESGGKKYNVLGVGFTGSAGLGSLKPCQFRFFRLR